MPIGIFVFSEKWELLYYKLFSRDPSQAVEEFSRVSVKDVPDIKGIKINEDTDAYRFLRKKIREYAISFDFVESEEDLNAFLNNFCITLSSKRLEGSIGRDRLIMQAANAYEDVGRIINLFHERLYEWFSLHYPEVKNTKDFADKVVSYGRRENFPDFKKSVGVDINEQDEQILIEFATTMQTLTEEKEHIEKYIRVSIKEIAPNMSSLLDSMLAARLLSLAGSLEKLARMPSSTIQLLGAEKALFRHLHKKGKSPKYGILYTSSVIQNSKPENRGKVARILAAQLMKATRIDFYSGRYEPKIKEELEKELETIK